MRLWLVLLCAATLAAGCGSSSGSNNASSGGTAKATRTTGDSPEIKSPDLKRLRPVAAATGQAPSSSNGRNAFLRQVFDDAEAMWQHEFQGAGLTYRPARLTIFNREVTTACGTHGAEVGPFYCAASFGVYLDPRFFAVLSRKVGVRLGDFAQAYVVAHEVGHHVQTLLGITRQKAVADRQHPAGTNARSVRFELQADCFAGVWVRSAYQQGEVRDADIQDALNAARVVGDDFLSNAGAGARPPEDWTHGSSAQRQHWFKIGFTQGDPDACDTFSH